LLLSGHAGGRECREGLLVGTGVVRGFARQGYSVSQVLPPTDKTSPTPMGSYI